MAFPEKLKALRLKHKLTQEELGEKRKAKNDE